MASTRRLAFALLASAAFAAGRAPASAQDEPKPAPAPAPAEEMKPASAKEAKVRKYLELMKWKDTMNEQFESSFAPLVRSGAIPKGFSKKFQEVADFAALEEVLVSVWMEVLDEETLDGLNQFLATDAGRKYVEAAKKTVRPLMEKVQPWAIETAMKANLALVESGGDEDDEGDEGAMGNLRKARRTPNEASAIATLRNLASCQAQVQCSGQIDCDRDGIGEYGTFLELTGSTGVRTGFKAGNGWAWSDFSTQGSPVKPAIMSPRLAGVDGDGVVVKLGYCFRIFLPDTTPVNAGFVHETGPKEKVGLAGGTGNVYVDLAETTWCAYAWPEKKGAAGKRAFFVNQSGDVTQSANERTAWEGKNAPPPHAAFLGTGITSAIAVGTAGGDGEVWKVSN